MKRADRSRIKEYYSSGREVERLASEDGWFERERTLHLLGRHIRASSRVLDIGGGSGVYARPLAQKGHSVTLVDLSPELIEIAREEDAKAPDGERLSSIVCADIASYEPQGSFDAVVCLGPGYHAGGAQEFARMCEHAARFARPGGLIFFAYLPRLTSVAGLISRAASNPEHVGPGVLTNALQEGVFRNDADGGFAEVYFATPEEVERGFEAIGVRCIEMCSVRGFAAYYGQELAQLRRERPEIYEEVWALTEATESLPEVVATSWHAMFIGEKPQDASH